MKEPQMLFSFYLMIVVSILLHINYIEKLESFNQRNYWDLALGLIWGISGAGVAHSLQVKNASSFFKLKSRTQRSLVMALLVA
ncbi:MAG: hypothetical protein AAFU64_18940, partial [Bacteroidota bacterium]